MRSAIVVMVCLTGCVSTEEFRDEVNRLNERSVVMSAQLAEVKQAVAALERAAGGTRAAMDRLEAGDATKFDDLRSRLVKELGDLRQEIMYSVDRAVSAMKGDVKRLEGEHLKATAALRADLTEEVERKVEAAAAALPDAGEDLAAIRKRIDQLEASIRRLEEERAEPEGAGSAEPSAEEPAKDATDAGT
jgi:chromosome segregation ATPase